MTPGEYLDKVLKSHQRKHVQPLWDKYHKKRQEITEFLKQEFKGELAGEPLNSGSYVKNTDVNISFDLDIVIPFRHMAFDGPDGIHETLLKTIQRNYGSSGVSIRPKRTAIGIKFPDRVGNEQVVIDMDLVPGMEQKLNDYKSSGTLILNNSNKGQGEKGSWIKTNISAQIRHVKADQRSNERKVIKLLKIWKKHNNQKISSFFIELITIRAFKEGEMKKSDLYGWLLNTLTFIADNIEEINLRDPGNKRNNVANMLSPEDKVRFAGTFRNMAKNITNKELAALTKLFPMNAIG